MLIGNMRPKWCDTNLASVIFVSYFILLANAPSFYFPQAIIYHQLF